MNGTMTVERCDFCGVDLDPVAGFWLLPAADFTVAVRPGGPLVRSVGPWSTCDACGALLVANAWSRLHDRCVAHIIEAGSPSLRQRAAIRAAVARGHRALRGHIQGRPYRVGADTASTP